jgi:hypothetical protein
MWFNEKVRRGEERGQRDGGAVAEEYSTGGD